MPYVIYLIGLGGRGARVGGLFGFSCLLRSKASVLEYSLVVANVGILGRFSFRFYPLFSSRKYILFVLWLMSVSRTRPVTGPCAVLLPETLYRDKRSSVWMLVPCCECDSSRVLVQVKIAEKSADGAFHFRVQTE